MMRITEQRPSDDAPGSAIFDQGERPDRLWRFDPRVRIITALVFSLCVVSLNAPISALLAVMAAAALAWLGGIGWRRLRYLLPFELLMLLLLVTLPFSVPTEPRLALGPLSVSTEGLAMASLIWLKANAVVLALFGLVAAMGARSAVQALAALGLPPKLCQLLLLTLRQIVLVGEEYRRLRLAMRVRAFVARADRHSWRVLGWLIGMLLVRSLDRAERVANAMRCRGFDGQFRSLGCGAWNRRDTALLLTVIPVCVGGLLVDRLGWAPGWPGGCGLSLWTD